MAKGIYERKGKNGDVTYYIRYQFKTRQRGGRGNYQRPKRKSRPEVAGIYAGAGTGST